MQPTKTIQVVAAIIKNEDKIFATKRGYGDFAGGWEFPGGKIEHGETPKEALIREIQEELDTIISVGELFEIVEYDYPTFHLTMHCFICEVINGELILNEHQEAKWLTRETLDSDFSVSKYEFDCTDMIRDEDLEAEIKNNDLNLNKMRLFLKLTAFHLK